MTGQDLVNAALKQIGVIASGETPSTDESNDAFERLNNLIASWSAQALPIFNITKSTIPLTGAASYNVTPRPVKIRAAKVTISGFESEFEIVTADEFADPTRYGVVFSDGGFPTTAVTLRPSPTTGSLDLFTLVPIDVIGSLGASINLPPGYERALVMNLAVEVAPQYGVPVSEVMIGLANDSKNSIQGLAQNTLGVPVPARQNVPQAQAP